MNGCNKFDYYLFGETFTVETDHKPILGLMKKPLSSLSPRLQRLAMKLQRYNFILKHVPGKDMFLADALSRAPMEDKIDTKYLEGKWVQVYSLVSLPDEEMQDYQMKTEEDEALKLIKNYVEKGWPNQKSGCPDVVKPYYENRDDINIDEDLLFLNKRLIIPTAKREEVLKQLHCAHQGIVACKRQARESVYWPGMTLEIEAMIKKCEICLSYSKSNSPEPLILRPVPDHVWQDVAMDFMRLQNEDYIVMVDYFSKFVEIQKLTSKTATSVVSVLKRTFRTHGIPARLFSDGGPPFDSRVYLEFLREYKIEHRLSSPKYPQSNGMIERTIQTVRGLLTKCKDGNLAMIHYNNTPKEDMPSPAEVLMGRKLRCMFVAYLKFVATC